MRLASKSPTRLEGMETMSSLKDQCPKPSSPTRLEGMETFYTAQYLDQVDKSPTRLEGMETSLAQLSHHSGGVVSDPP